MMIFFNRLKELLNEDKKKTVVNKVLFFITGLGAVVWFLIRVIPKPSRATYPCQRVAFPIASMFVIWLTGAFSAGFFLKNAKRKFKQSKYIQFIISFVLGIILSFLVFQYPSVTDLFAADQLTTNKFEPVDSLNNPVGKAIGISPGRVSWVHDPAAATWNGNGYWWEDNSTDPEKVSFMLSKAITDLTGTTSDEDAWGALFRYFNKNHGKGDIGYSAHEKIIIKLNMNMVKNHDQRNNAIFNSPQMVEALLKQLVNKAGVPASQITFYDISRYIPDIIYDRCKDQFPDVHFIDNSLGKNGRETFQLDTLTQVKWSETLENGKKTYLPKFVKKAAYIINMANLKGHIVAGVTICAKNHFGTFNCSPNGNRGPVDAGVHPYISVNENNYGNKRPMGSYNALVDLMGHEHLGEKTLLFIVDALYTTASQNDHVKNLYKMELPPFNGDWMSSIFLSQDGVAIESVGLDFLRSETGEMGRLVFGNVDNYLHEAAHAGNPPSSVFYDPEGDGIKLKSLGVHEHWNDAVHKQYSRNLKTGKGIELVYTDASSETSTSIKANISKPDFVDLRLYPNPVINNYSNILISSDYTGDFLIEIVDTRGRTIKSFTFNKINQQFSRRLDLSGLGEGSYICVYSNKKKIRESIKFLKQ